MQNSCAYGKEACSEGYRMKVPMEEKKDPIVPDIRSRTTQKFSDRQLEYAPTENATNYDIFPVQKMKKTQKRVTCCKKGSEEYQTIAPKKHSTYIQK